jgi:hypothetical protein
MHARSADTGHEQSAEGQRLVADRLGGETESGAASDEAVAGIELALLRGPVCDEMLETYPEFCARVFGRSSDDRKAEPPQAASAGGLNR